MADKQPKGTFDSIRILKDRLKDGSFREILADWKWIFQCSARYRGQIILYTLLGMLGASLGLVGSIAGKYLIDVITGRQTDRIWFFALLAVFSTLMNLTLRSALDRISVKLTLTIQNDMQSDLFSRLFDADWMEASRYASGDLITRFSSDVGTVASNAVNWMPKVIIAVYQFLATFCVILYYDAVMALFALASAPILLLCSRYILGRQRAFSKQAKEAGSDLSAFAVESFHNYDTVKSFGIAEYGRARLKERQQRYRKISLDFQLFSMKTNIFMSVLGMCVEYAAFGYCLFRLWTNSISFGTMTLFLQQRSQLTAAFNQVVGIFPMFLSCSVSAHRIREILDLRKEPHLSAPALLSEAASSGLTISFQDVDFSYRENRKILQASSLHACPGEIIALVGASGEGKTTLIRLMLGLIRPDSGVSVIRTADGTAYPANADTRSLFAYVPQGNTILSGTIADNLRMIRPDADDAALEAALRTACAWEFVEKLPEGMYTAVGEHGKGLSEGQAQRIAIARAVLRDAPILLLDEATSALDVATERRVLRSIMRQAPYRTCIVTTHRPTVLSLCSRVYRVMDTRVTELDAETSAAMAMDF